MKLKANQTIADLVKNNPVLQRLLAEGKAINVGEFRMYDAGARGWMDKETGKRMTFSGVWHTVEYSNKSMQIGDASPATSGEGFQTETYKCPFEKGDIVAVELVALGYVKGKGDRWRGILHHLDEALTTPAPAGNVPSR